MSHLVAVPTAGDLNGDLLDLCVDLCKAAVHLIDEKLAAKPEQVIVIEKVASAGGKTADPALINLVVDAFAVRGMINDVDKGGREKLASILQNPDELASTLLEMTNMVRPVSGGSGVPVDLPSLSVKSASHQDSEASDEEAEKREWQDLARNRQLK